jgi:hypothetical protein
VAYLLPVVILVGYFALAALGADCSGSIIDNGDEGLDCNLGGEVLVILFASFPLVAVPIAILAALFDLALLLRRRLTRRSR